MREPDQQFFDRFKRLLGIFIGVAVGQVALADPEEPDAGFSGTAGIMPRKGGRTDLSDEEIIRAIEFMVAQVAQ